ncbi:MAG: HesA/MoeB/ThiF family protein [Chitinophagales bacterium]
MEKPELIETLHRTGERRPYPAPLVIEDIPDDRYSRLRLIPWWDQDILRKAKIMVVGAGALGNEIVKNLALLGVGNILIIDLDTIENSNLSRSILYRESDEGQPKAAVAAQRAKEINPDCRTAWLQVNAAYDLGLGVYRWADVVLGGLDNREARLAVNQACWKVGTPWIDGAIEVLFGIARAFIPPDGPCYECTMNETDYRLLNLRKSCALLTRNEMISGKVPTTPTSASVIAGIQVQEAVKLIHNRPDLPTLAGKGFFFNGLTYDSYVIEYQHKESCPAHDTYRNIKSIPLSVHTTHLDNLLNLVHQELGDQAIIQLEREIITSLDCSNCSDKLSVFKGLGQVTQEEARCQKCGNIRTPILTHQITGKELFLSHTLSEIGVPPFDIVTGTAGDRLCHFELTGDRDQVLGGLDY